MATANTHIEITTGVCGGRPRIAGTRIRVQDVALWHERMRLSVDEIVSRHRQLSIADVFAAMAYYHDHRPQIESQIKGRQAADEIREFL